MNEMVSEDAKYAVIFAGELRIQHGVCVGCGRQTVYPK
jgi:hypothetical protein